MIQTNSEIFGVDLQRIIAFSPIVFGILLLLFFFIWLSRRRDKN